MKVNWTQTAFERLAEIKAIKVSENTPAQAKQWLESVFAAVTTLQKYPHLGNELVEADGDFRELPLDGYRMIYRVEGATLHILTLRPASADGRHRQGIREGDGAPPA